MTKSPIVVVLGSYAPSLVNFRGPMIEALAARGYEVVAMAPTIDPSVQEQLEALGATALEAPMARNSLNPLEMFRSIRRLKRILSEINPVAIISYTIQPVILGSVAAAHAGVPKIIALVTGLGFAFTEGKGAKRKLSRLAAGVLYRWALKRAGTIIFQNPDDRDFFQNQGMVRRNSKVAVVNGSGIDLDRFAQVSLPEKPVFLMIARLIADKGVREYAAAATRLKRRYPDTVFRLVGYLDPAPNAITRVELDGMIAGGIEFLGKLDDVRPVIAGAGIFVLPSFYREGTPRSSLEAMAMGRTVITTDAPGCRETVEDGRTGFLVPPRDAASLEAAMERFIASPELIAEMGARSRELAERKFEVQAVNQSIFTAAGL
jgi:glycosyltransferase involved in cell wall biosynthesis